MVLHTRVLATRELGNNVFKCFIRGGVAGFEPGTPTGTMDAALPDSENVQWYLYLLTLKYSMHDCIL